MLAPITIRSEAQDRDRLTRPSG